MRYLLEAIIVFWIISKGMRLLDSLFNKPASTVAPDNSTWQGGAKKTTTQTSTDAEYIDYEEVK
jgi:hypothetical protein